jgi:hypothetical protein
VTEPKAAALEDLVARFRAATLPKAEWTHAAHLAVGAWHVARRGPEGALEVLRGAIRRLNESHGTLNSDTSGYHETVTYAYTVLIAGFLAATPGSLPEQVRALLASPLAERDVLLRFYSRDRLMGVAARRGRVGPDRRELGWPIADDAFEAQASS